MNTPIVASKRYVYDLGEELRTLAQLGHYPPDSDVPMAWIVEHLRFYHLLDMPELNTLVHRSDVQEVDERIGPRLARGLTKTLYRLFRPMADHALQAAYTSTRFKNDHLSVTIFDDSYH